MKQNERKGAAKQRPKTTTTQRKFKECFLQFYVCNSQSCCLVVVIVVVGEVVRPSVTSLWPSQQGTHVRHQDHVAGQHRHRPWEQQLHETKMSVTQCQRVKYFWYMSYINFVKACTKTQEHIWPTALGVFQGLCVCVCVNMLNKGPHQEK